jgi:bacterioferritin-associated ferredoxin
MYVCVCLAVTEAEVREAIESGARTRDAVTRTCLAGGDCGACHGMIESMIEDHLDPPIRPCVGVHAKPHAKPHDCPPPAVSSEQLVPETALVARRKTAA